MGVRTEVAIRVARLLAGLALPLAAACTFGVLEGLDEGNPRDGDAGCVGAECVSCMNERQDPGESGVDCGGTSGCPRCEPGASCGGDADCVSKLCSESMCAAPTCDDERANGSETDTDCGGADAACKRCAAGKMCTDTSDCAEGACKSGRCQAPSCTDGLHNGDEAGTDCGGSCTTLCGAGERCEQPTDCTMGMCILEHCRENSTAAPLALPGTIEAEDFDLGGAGVGYADGTAGNAGTSTYRDSDVDLDSASDGTVVAHTAAEEWLAYTVQIAAAADDYNFELRASGGEAAASVHFEIDGSAVGPSFTIPKSGDATLFTVVEKNKLELPAGTHVLRLVFDSGTPVINWLRVSRGAVPFGGMAHMVPGKVEAEDFNVGGEGVAYHNALMGARYPELHRSTDVDLEACTDPGCATQFCSSGGFNIRDTKSNDWVEYTVSADAGEYILRLRVASDESGKKITVLLDGTPIVNQQIAPNTGGWQTFSLLTYPGIDFLAGEHKIRIVFVDGLVNLNWFSFSQN